MNEIRELTKEELWELREQITLDEDYSNDFGISEYVVETFFTEWMNQVDEIIVSNLPQGEEYNFWDEFKLYDNPEELEMFRDWYFNN